MIGLALVEWSGLARARAQALAANNMFDWALPIFEAGLNERKALWLARPGEAVRLRDYMVAMKGLGDMLADNGRVAESCARYREVSALIQRIKSRQPLTGLDTSDTLANLARRQGKLCPSKA